MTTSPPSTVAQIPPLARRALAEGVHAHHPLSNLERLGLPARVLNLLENSRFQIVMLADLLACSQDDLLSIDLIGPRSMEQIFQSMSQYDRLPQEPSSANQGF